MGANTLWLSALLLGVVVEAYWDGSKDTPDPYTQAMMMSRQAQYDPEALRKNPNHFRELFGRLAVEQNQAKAMDETQSQFTPEDKCLVCHGTTVELEIMMAERHGHGKRDQVKLAEILEKICHLDRYQYHDPVNITKRHERSRTYGGIAPPIFANACKHVVQNWDDRDEVRARTLRWAACVPSMRAREWWRRTRARARGIARAPPNRLARVTGGEPPHRGWRAGAHASRAAYRRVHRAGELVPRTQPQDSRPRKGAAGARACIRLDHESIAQLALRSPLCEVRDADASALVSVVYRGEGGAV